MDRCTFCGNKNLTAKQVQYIYKHAGELLIVNDVPCIECNFCGEQYFEGSVIEKIEEIFTDLQTKKRVSKTNIIAPVENYSEMIL